MEEGRNWKFISYRKTRRVKDEKIDAEISNHDDLSGSHGVDDTVV
jgi:hypothetical protein